MLSPLPRRSDWMSCFAHPSSRISLPRKGCQVGLRIVLFEDCSAFTRVTACTLALSPYFVTRFTRRLQPFRYLHSCSGCFRLEHFAGWDLHPQKSAAFARRTPGNGHKYNGPNSGQRAAHRVSPMHPAESRLSITDRTIACLIDTDRYHALFIGGHTSTGNSRLQCAGSI